MPENDQDTGLPGGSVDVLTRDEVSLDKGWNTVLFNDPISLFGFVIDTLMKIGLTEDEAQSKAKEAHDLGKAIVFHGTREEAETKVVLLHSAKLHAKAEAA